MNESNFTSLLIQFLKGNKPAKYPVIELGLVELNDMNAKVTDDYKHYFELVSKIQVTRFARTSPVSK